MRDYLPPARLWSLIEAAAAALLMFLPVTQDQTAGILAVFALVTGEKVVRVIKANSELAILRSGPCFGGGLFSLLTVKRFDKRPLFV
jgi:hypothetical protein